MKISESHRQRNLISLTPLIDVVFILLIFFMLASSFVKWKFIQIALGEPEELPLNLKSQSLITVDFNEAYYLNEKKSSLDDIVAEVKSKIHQQRSHPVLVKPVNNLPLQQLIVALDALNAVAGTNLSLVKDQIKTEE